MPIPVAVRSRTRFCTLAGIAASNPFGGMDVSLLWMLFVVRLRPLHRDGPSFRGALPIVACVSVIMKLRQWESSGSLWAVALWKLRRCIHKYIHSVWRWFTTYIYNVYVDVNHKHIQKNVRVVRSLTYLQTVYEDIFSTYTKCVWTYVWGMSTHCE
jgi:hypothetical protein